MAHPEWAGLWNCNTVVCVVRFMKLILNEHTLVLTSSALGTNIPVVSDFVSDSLKASIKSANLLGLANVHVRVEIGGGTVSKEVLCRPLSTNCLSFAFSPSLLVANFRFL